MFYVSLKLFIFILLIHLNIGSNKSCPWKNSVVRFLKLFKYFRSVNLILNINKMDKVLDVECLFYF